MPKRILNIAAGKFDPIGLDEGDPYFLINLDPMYYRWNLPEAIEDAYADWDYRAFKKLYSNIDAFEFMERTKIMFTDVCVYRFLEHVPFTKVDYFIYLLSTITEKDAIVDIIVPDYFLLAKMIMGEKVGSPGYEAHNILLTTELLNEPSCPHASIWTVERARHYFELEGRFEIMAMRSEFPFDGREIYLRFQARRL